MSATATDIFEHDASFHAATICDLRQALCPDFSAASASLTDSDCLRFLRARQGSVSAAAEMVQAWHEWRHTLQEALPPDHNIPLSPNILLAHPHPVIFHPHKDLLPCAHCGNDMDGRPIYWERTGYAQSRFDEVVKHFSLDEMLQYHIMSQESFQLRLAHNSRVLGRAVTDTVVVFDMQHLTMSLSVFSIQFLKRMIHIDQNYYPETLHRLFVINAPWYFTTLYAIFKPLVEKRTRDKIVVLGGQYQEALQQNIAPDQIPEEYGGSWRDLPWGGPFPAHTGVSEEQVREHMLQKYGSEERLGEAEGGLRPEEVASLQRAWEAYREKTTTSTTATSTTASSTTATSTTATSTTASSDSSIGDRNGVQCDRQQSEEGEERRARPLSAPRMPVSALSQVSCYGDPASQKLLAVKLIRTDITHVEDTDHCHLYAIDIRYRNVSTWKTLRRYSDFRLFMKEMKKLNATCERHFPPRKWIFKKSSAVVQKRQHMLNLFLKRAIILCINSQHPHGIDTLVTFLRLDDKLDRITATGSSTAGPGRPLVRRQSSVSFAPDVSDIQSTRGLLPSLHAGDSEERNRSDRRRENHTSPPPSPRSSSSSVHPSASPLFSPSNTRGGQLDSQRDESEPHSSDRSNSGNHHCDSAGEGFEEQADMGGVRCLSLLPLLLLGLSFLCAVEYGSYFLFFDAFDIDRQG